MKKIVLGHIIDLRDHCSSVCTDLKNILADNECIGDYRIQTKKELSEQTERLTELNKCVKFLK